jgi:hypothetical protein
MSDVVHERPVVLVSDDGERYTVVRTYARGMPYGAWEGWLEFVTDEGRTLESQRETTQSKRQDVAYWAEGLEPIFLEGALRRALQARRNIPAR